MSKDPRLARAGVSGYNKPKRTPNHKTKSHVVVAKEGDNAGGNNILPRMFGYRDRADMTDGGGAYASGGLYQGGGAYSTLANLGAALSGEDLGQRQTYVDQYIDQQKGAGFAEQMKIGYPQYYQQLVADAMRNM